MSELRQNPTTKEWVILATERAKRPRRRFGRRGCPFCPGNEAETPPEVAAHREDESSPWHIRVFPNKFPVLTPEGDSSRREEGLFRSMAGVGVHEVIADSANHRETMGTMDERQVEELCLAYRERYLSLEGKPEIKLIIVFKNYGQMAGTSLGHPHSQLVATPIVPHSVRMRLEEAIRYHDDRGNCLFCDMISQEAACGDRIVLETEGFVALEPYASRSPFETWLLPKAHQATFGEASAEEAKALGRALRMVLRKIHHGLKDPDYNYVIHTAPISDRGEPYYHWHLQILPRLSTVAGFELGSGIHINTSYPEECAEFLRNVSV